MVAAAHDRTDLGAPKGVVAQVARAVAGQQPGAQDGAERRALDGCPGVGGDVGGYRIGLLGRQAAELHREGDAVAGRPDPADAGDLRARLADARTALVSRVVVPEVMVPLVGSVMELHLIRDEADRGALVICDPRLVDKPYGKRIWRSLPPMRRTREIADVEAFFARPRRICRG